MLVDKIIIERHPSKIDKDGRRHYLIRAIPYQDPQQEAERLKAVHEARVKIVPPGSEQRRSPVDWRHDLPISDAHGPRPVHLGPAIGLLLSLRGEGMTADAEQRLHLLRGNGITARVAASDHGMRIPCRLLL